MNDLESKTFPKTITGQERFKKPTFDEASATFQDRQGGGVNRIPKHFRNL